MSNRKRWLIYSDDEVDVYYKKSPVTGYEADAAVAVLAASLVGARQFALHLSDPIEFMKEFGKTIDLLFGETKRVVLKEHQKRASRKK